MRACANCGVEIEVKWNCCPHCGPQATATTKAVTGLEALVRLGGSILGERAVDGEGVSSELNRRWRQFARDFPSRVDTAEYAVESSSSEVDPILLESYHVLKSSALEAIVWCYLRSSQNRGGSVQAREEAKCDLDAARWWAEYMQSGGWGHRVEELLEVIGGLQGDGQRRGCFISTAAARVLGCCDDSPALNLLRGFRDDYMCSTSLGQREVEQYYRIAPSIVAAIGASGEAQPEWERVCQSHLLPAIDAIGEGRPREAHALYRAMVLELQDKWLVPTGAWTSEQASSQVQT